MEKYSFDFKLKVVKAYLNGDGGYKAVAKYYEMKSFSLVQRWANTYKEFGEKGLLHKKKNKIYTVQMKLDAIELYLTTEMSIREVANHFDIINHPMLSTWLKKYRENGIDGLSSSKGCPVKMKNEKSKDSILPVDNKERNRIVELEKQVRLLQIENAYLKELRRLRREETLSKTKWSQASSTTSEDNSN